MEENVLLSIIIPNYNKAKYLRRCLDSIISQDLSGVEIIVLDDCSTDNSLDILREYKNINLMVNRKNQGICETRNRGLEISSGKYVTFLDSDDYVTCDYIASIKCSLFNRSNLYIFDVRKFIDGKFKKDYVCKECGLVGFDEYITKYPDEYLKSYISYWVWNKVFQKDIISELNLKFESYDCEDEDFCSKYMLAIDRIFFINKQLHNYCVNDESTSKRNNILYSEPFKVVSNNNYNAFVKYGCDLDILEHDILKMFNVGYNLSCCDADKERLIKNKDELIKKIRFKGYR